MAKTWHCALITGASSGIGEGFARKLAERGTNLVIVARRTERLEALAHSLRSSKGIDVEVLTADLTDRAALRRVEDRLASSEAPVDLLVNNAGVISRGQFAELDIDRKTDEIVVDVLAVVRLTRAALPGMIAGHHGGIVNVSSITSFFPVPTMATYSASKAFVTTFSEAVGEELRGTGVVVSALCPGVTPTEFGGQAELDLGRTGMPTTSVATVVDAGLRGLDRGQIVVVPGVFNDMSIRAMRLFPRSLVRRGAAMSTCRATSRGGASPPVA